MRTLCLLAIGLLLACGDDDGGRSEGTEVGDCTDRADNDGDGLFDCDDPGCAGSPDCRDAGTDEDAGMDASADTSVDSAVDGGPDANVGATCALPSGVGCGEGAWCVPDPDDEEVGTCQLVGVGEDGDPCVEQSGCAESFLCTADGVCRRVCTLSSAEDCDEVEAEFCVSPNPGDARVGYCGHSCTMFGTDPECPDGEWCAGGSCFPRGPGAEDDPCGPGMPFCGEGLACLEGACEVRCQQGAAPGSAGDTCEGDDLCFAFCLPPCDYDGAGTCPDAGDTCVPEEVFGEGDHCRPLVADLAHGASCSDADLTPGEFCGAFRTCLGGDPSVCADLCRPSVQAYGTTNHPDCSDASATCIDPGVAEVDYGYCGSPP